MSSESKPTPNEHDITAPAEGRASSYEAIADELSDALLAFEHIDYNALTVDELYNLLEVRETIEELCLRYRRQQHQTNDDKGGTP